MLIVSTYFIMLFKLSLKCWDFFFSMESAAFRLKAPKKKRRVYVSKEPPFPIPIESLSSTPASAKNWHYYTGHIVDNAVVVEHTGDMDRLFSMVRRSILYSVYFVSSDH